MNPFRKLYDFFVGPEIPVFPPESSRRTVIVNGDGAKVAGFSDSECLANCVVNIHLKKPTDDVVGFDNCQQVSGCSAYSGSMRG